MKSKITENVMNATMIIGVYWSGYDWRLNVLDRELAKNNITVSDYELEMNYYREELLQFIESFKVGYIDVEEKKRVARDAYKDAIGYDLSFIRDHLKGLRSGVIH